MGIPVVADMEWADWPLVSEFMAAVDHLLVPHHFAIEVTGLQDPAAAIKALTPELRGCTAVTCGREGCYYMTRRSQTVEHLRAVNVQTVETTGCGDVFHGAYAAALSRGSAIPDCLRWASAAAAVYASRPGGWEYLPTSQDVDTLLSTT
jgi:sugar/nucleoside kinase (ribokinase family)